MSNSSVNQNKKYLLLEGTEKLVYEPLQKLTLPYVLLPVSLIQDKYFRVREGKEMLCKIQHFRKEKRLQSTFKTSSMSTLHNSDAEQSVLIIIYGSLRVLQMGLFRNHRTKIKRRKSLNSKS